MTTDLLCTRRPAPCAIAADQFLAKQCSNVKGEHKKAFFAQCSFFAGEYDDPESFSRLNEHLAGLEKGGKANRLFFFSIPPTIFGDVVKCVAQSTRAPGGGWTRLILEKPFGRDSKTFAALNAITSNHFTEDELFRIDHYLGKEVVLNLVALRFGNQIFEPVWNHEHIKSVEIVFKEDLGTGGRGGYFDNFGIIRDIMQNHLLQVLMWFAMEPPRALTREAIAERKCELLSSMETVQLEDVFLGQFGSNTWEIFGQEHNEPGYLEDPTVPKGSKCPTFAAVGLRIDNDRWRGVPFVMSAGKGQDERVAEVRVTFKSKPVNKLVGGNPNQLVMRIQPDEAIYVKYQNKIPGWSQNKTMPVVLDMSYKNNFPDAYVADAYERMFLNAAKGDGSLFVGSEELTEAWRVFTPVLDKIDQQQPAPVVHPFGTTPVGLDKFLAKWGITKETSWQEYLASHAKHRERQKEISEIFLKIDEDRDGEISAAELKKFAKQFFDGREPSDKQVAMLMARMDKDANGTITFKELLHAADLLAGYCFDPTSF